MTWRYGVNLSCPHKTHIELGTAEDFGEAFDLAHAEPHRADGYWPKARRCDECKRPRAVRSCFVELVAA